MPNRLILQESTGSVQVFLHRDGQAVAEPCGEPFPFLSPFSAEEMEDLRWYLEDYLEAPYAVYQERGEEIAGRFSSWGERLFSAVFGEGPPRDGYQRAREAGSCEVWASSGSPAFLGLPWELLKDPERPEPLALDGLGIHRTLATATAAAELRPGERLRVLMVISRPYGRKDVGFRMIARPLLERLAPVSGDVDLEVLRPPAFDTFRRRLEEAREAGEPFHVVHFDGHGTFGTLPGGTPQGFLVFETELGTSHLVPADKAASALSGSGVPLFVLNACRSGQIDGGAGPEAAVATRLLEGGAEAVVAMGWKIYAVAAAELMAAFYEALFAGKPVSQAVTEGRRQLHKANLRPSPKGFLPLKDWIVPVHYERREVAFPQLRRVEARPEGLSLFDALADFREERKLPEGVHPEGDLAPVGGHFFGRDAEFQELEKALRLRRVAVIHGVGGTGKTELAKGFARWLRDSGGLDDPGLVFFHSFEPGVASFGLDGVVGSVGLRLFGADFARLDPAQRRHAVLEALRQCRMLLVWDNFESVHSQPETARPGPPPLDEEQRRAVRDFLAVVVKEGKGGVIVTSRSREEWLGDVHRLEVGGLDAQDANELAEVLLAGLGRARERRRDRAYPELLELLGGHPLSLRLILPQLEKVADARELVEALRGERDHPAGFEGGEGRLDSLGACVHYSFRHLPEEDQDRLPVLTMFEGVVDLNTLAVLSGKEEAPERFRGIDREKGKLLLGSCVSLGLLTPLSAEIFRIHPALPAYLTALWKLRAGEAFPAEREAARVASIRAHSALSAWLRQQFGGGEAATAMTVLALEQRSLGLAAAEALERGMYKEAQTILLPLNDFWDARGLRAEARGWTDRCRALLQDREGRPPGLETPPGALWMFVTSAQARRTLLAGALDEAEAEYDNLRRMLEALDGEIPRRNLGVAYGSLGAVSLERGDFSGAEDWYGRSLEIFEDLGYSAGMADSYHQLGRVAHEQGDLPAAEPLYRKSLDLAESLGDHRGVARSCHQLGMLAEEWDDLSEAESWYRRSIDVFERLGDRSSLPAGYAGLGLVCQKRGDLTGAEGWYRRGLEISELLGDRPGMTASCHQLGMIAEARGNFSEAELWLRKALEIKEAMGDRPGMAPTCAELGVLAQARGDLQAALAWTVRGVSLFPRFPHPATAGGPHNLAVLTARLGMPALEEAWRRCTGAELPAAVRAWVESQVTPPASPHPPTPASRP